MVELVNGFSLFQKMWAFPLQFAILQHCCCCSPRSKITGVLLRGTMVQTCIWHQLVDFFSSIVDKGFPRSFVFNPIQCCCTIKPHEDHLICHAFNASITDFASLAPVTAESSSNLGIVIPFKGASLHLAVKSLVLDASE